MGVIFILKLQRPNYTPSSILDLIIFECASQLQQISPYNFGVVYVCVLHSDIVC